MVECQIEFHMVFNNDCETELSNRPVTGKIIRIELEINTSTNNNSVQHMSVRLSYRKNYFVHS